MKSLVRSEMIRSRFGPAVEFRTECSFEIDRTGRNFGAGEYCKSQKGDPQNGTTEFTLLDMRQMDLSMPAPEDWYESEEEVINIIYGMYSDWWIPGTLTRSAGVKAFGSGELPARITDRIRVSFREIPSKDRCKGLLPERLDNKEVIPR